MTASFDPQCHDLASYFTYQDKGIAEAQVNDLAQTIQTAIEDWLSNLESDREAARQSSADMAAGI